MRPFRFSWWTKRRLAGVLMSHEQDCSMAAVTSNRPIEAGVSGSDVIDLLRRPERGLFPLSLNQRDMWFQNQIHLGPGLNNMGAKAVFAGPLRLDLIRQAWQELVDRHDALRTVFVEREGEQYQLVLKEVAADFPAIDISGGSPQEQLQQVSVRCRRLLATQYDFSERPPYRAELLRLSEEEHVLLFAFSHLILDFYYVARLFEQFATVYQTLIVKGSVDLPSIEIQYTDVAVWQQERLQRGLLRQHEDYWHRQLELPLPTMELPTDRNNHRVRSFELRPEHRRVPEDVVNCLRSFRERYGATLFRVIMAAYEILMARLVGDGVLIGVSLSLSPPQLSDTIGFFAHEVPVRISLKSIRNFKDLLDDVKKQIQEAKKHMEYPLSEAVRGLKIDRDQSRPLFPVAISQIKGVKVAIGDLRMEMTPTLCFSAVYDLCLTVGEAADGLDLIYHY